MTPAALLKASAIAGAAVVGVPVQAAALRAGTTRLGARAAERVPLLFHRLVCRTLGVRITVEGTPPPVGVPTLILANHVSWLDIPVIGSLRPLAFVSKAEVRDWPGFGLLARLQRTVFVDRTRRSATAAAASEMGERLGGGGTLVLFAEGTTGDGTRVLPFKSSLLGAVQERFGGAGEVLIQPLSLVYRGRHGLPGGRRGRADLAWAGDAELMPHLTMVLEGGPIDVRLVWGEPLPASAAASRKEAARLAEVTVRRNFARAAHR